jgi:CRP-like cAMP-binding protein
VTQAAIGELLNFKIFEGFSSENLSQLCGAGEVIVSKHRQQLYQIGQKANSFGVVLSGAYKLSRPNPNGEDTIVYFSTPGDIIAAFIMPQPDPIYPISVHAMGPSRFLKIPREVFLNNWKLQPDLLFKIQGLLSCRFGNLQAQMTLAKAPLSSKIAFLLMDILKRYDGDDAVLYLPLTRQEIADSLGASVESVIRIMSDWSKSGIIETHDQKIKVLKLDKIVEKMSLNSN